MIALLAGVVVDVNLAVAQGKMSTLKMVGAESVEARANVQPAMVVVVGRYKITELYSGLCLYK